MKKLFLFSCFALISAILLQSPTALAHCGYQHNYVYRPSPYTPHPVYACSYGYSSVCYTHAGGACYIKTPNTRNQLHISGCLNVGGIQVCPSVQAFAGRATNCHPVGQSCSCLVQDSHTGYIYQNPGYVY